MALGLLSSSGQTSAQETQNQPYPIRQNLGQLPASYAFGLPGITRTIEERENIDQTAVTLSQTAPKQAQFAAPFKQSDIVEDWEMEVTIAQTVAAGGGTITASPYFPYSAIGALSLNMQNQFNTIDVPNGIDLMIFSALRPKWHHRFRNLWEQNPYANAYGAQANQVSGSGFSSASTSITFTVDLPVGIDFDIYFDIEADGELYSNKAAPQRAFVSPALMAGTTRIVQPRVQFNSGFAATADAGMYTTSGGTPTFSGTATLGFQRSGYYQPVAAADTPPVYNWQYVREARQVPLGAVTKARIPIAFDGQILATYLRLFDPTSGIGAPITVQTVKVCRLQYGASLNKYDDIPLSAQRREIRQHGFLLPEGVIVYDLATDKWGRVTNQYALNTLNTANVSYYMELTSAPGSGAYAVIGVEGLKYVAVS